MRYITRLPMRIAFTALVFVALLGWAAPGQAQTYSGSYVVQSGDSLFVIAVRFNVGLSDLATLNRIYDINTIYVGETLLLPAQLPPGYYATNPIYSPAPGATTPAPYTAYRSYTVRAGDYLNALAIKYKTTAQAIIDANKATVADPNILYVGQVILIPYTVKPAALPPPKKFHGNFYIVQPGDTLASIAAHFGQNMYTIAQVNGILNLNTVYAGTSLLIP